MLKNLHPFWRNHSFPCQPYLAYMGANSLAKSNNNNNTFLKTAQVEDSKKNEFEQ